LKKYDLQESNNNFKIKCIVSLCESGPRTVCETPMLTTARLLYGLCYDLCFWFMEINRHVNLFGLIKIHGGSDSPIRNIVMYLYFLDDSIGLCVCVRVCTCECVYGGNFWEVNDPESKPVANPKRSSVPRDITYRRPRRAYITNNVVDSSRHMADI